jgi:hypothetical protein
LNLRVLRPSYGLLLSWTLRIILDSLLRLRLLELFRCKLSSSLDRALVAVQRFCLDATPAGSFGLAPLDYAINDRTA